MSIKRPKYEEDSVDSINISPLIDVLFILLIFFIVTMVFSDKNAVEIDSPVASNATLARADSIYISIDREGVYYYESQAYSLEELERKCIELSRAKKIAIMLEADANATVQSVVSLINMTRGIGIDDVYVVADKNDG